MPYQRLIRLRDDLLNHTNWPEDFEWDWDACRKCAMGLLAEQENLVPEREIEPAVTQTASILDIKATEARFLFFDAFIKDGRIESSVTPEMAADVITDWLVRKDR